MKLVEVVWHLLLSPLYVAIFLVAAAPGLIMGGLDIFTCVFAGIHEGAHMRTAKLLDVRYKRLNPLVIAYPNATPTEILFCNLAPLVLLPFGLASFFVATTTSGFLSYFALFLGVGFARYSLPSRTDVYSILGNYTLSLAHVVLAPPIVVLAIIRAPRYLSTLVDYLIEIAWIVVLYVAIDMGV